MKTSFFKDQNNCDLYQFAQKNWRQLPPVERSAHTFQEIYTSEGVLVILWISMYIV